MFRFIAKQSFLVNLLAAIALVFVLGLLFFQSLGWLTHHGESLQVPSVTGKNVDSAISLLQDKGFDVIITDSLYNDSLPLNTVKKQLPDAGAKVKVNRTVFLNVNPTTLPMIEMPNLEGLSYRFAVDKLTKNHLELGDTSYKPNFMKGSVLEQDYNGKKIAFGSKVRWGSKIDLVLGGGLEQIKVPVPDLTGLTVQDATALLQSKGIIMAAILSTENISDTSAAYIYRQNPPVIDNNATPNFIQPGQTMDIWIQQEAVARDTTRIDSSQILKQ
ncbi:MAG TPA: PASTA domain-containing protein [Hanamia sp.]|nr:PASTA domain-containing protein [Hanamia sp.]